MAISIDKVYQTVQDLLNVEQRGYLPGRDFNNFANLAQIDLFGKLFSDNTFYMRRGAQELDSDVQEKIDIFVAEADLGDKDGGKFALPSDTYKLKDVYLTVGTKVVIAEKLEHKMSRYFLSSPLTAPTSTFPKYRRFSSGASGIGDIEVYPSDISSGVSVDYIKTPSAPEWGSRNVMGTAMYDETISIDFELHHSMEDELVDKILVYAALSIKQTDVIQFAQAERAADRLADQTL